MRRITAILILVFTLLLPVKAATKWESTDAPISRSIEMVDADQARIGTDGSCIYINVGQRVEVKVFTILGQIVVSQTLEPGNYRLPIASRGIYIVKIGTTTRRIII